MDTCPICNEPKVMQCRCWISERNCKNGHSWVICPVHGEVIIGSSHGKTLNIPRNGCLCILALYPPEERPTENL